MGKERFMCSFKLFFLVYMEKWSICVIFEGFSCKKGEVRSVCTMIFGMMLEILEFSSLPSKNTAGMIIVEVLEVFDEAFFGYMVMICWMCFTHRFSFFATGFIGFVW